MSGIVSIEHIAVALVRVEEEKMMPHILRPLSFVLARIDGMVMIHYDGRDKNTIMKGLDITIIENDYLDSVTPKRMYARRNSDGVSVNESALCEHCMHGDGADDSYQWWIDADDVNPDKDDPAFHPSDNTDARCGSCFSPTLWIKKG